jgi:hypothetical protein
VIDGQANIKFRDFYIWGFREDGILKAVNKVPDDQVSFIFMAEVGFTCLSQTLVIACKATRMRT